MNTHIVTRAFILAAVLASTSSIVPALAQSRGGAHPSGGMHSAPTHPSGGHPSGGWRGGGWWHGGADWWGVGLGLGLGWDLSNYGYPYPGYYYYYPPQSGVIVETPPSDLPPAPSANPQANAVWYYCASAKAYYPYVRQCPENWQIVPATPPVPAPAQ